jgi:hypothetical protein
LSRQERLRATITTDRGASFPPAWHEMLIFSIKRNIDISTRAGSVDFRNDERESGEEEPLWTARYL